MRSNRAGNILNSAPDRNMKVLTRPQPALTLAQDPGRRPANRRFSPHGADQEPQRV